MEDREILEKLWARDPEGLTALMNRYGGYVSTVVWRIVSSVLTVQDGEELVSDVFLAAWENRNKLREGKLKAWPGRSHKRYILKENGRINGTIRPFLR